MIFAFARKDLGHSARRLRLVFLILLIGFVGPLFASSLRTSVRSYLEASSRQILSADLTVSSLRPFVKKEIEWMRSALTASELIGETEFVTMAKGAGVSSLVEVKGVEPEYPVHGRFTFEGGARSENAAALSESERIAWVYPEVLAQLGLKVGEKIGLGKSEFRIVATLSDAPTGGRALGFAPRVFIGRRFVEETGLVAFGSQVFYRTHLALPETLTGEAAAEKVKSALRDPDIFIRTPDDSIQGFERFFKFFNLYLVALTMIVFVLSWASAFYIFQLFLHERLKSAAILMINGASRRFAASLIGIQVVFVTLASFAISAAVVHLATLVANRVFVSQYPEGFSLAVSGVDLMALGISALVSALAFNGPFLVRLYFLKPQTLLGESALGVQSPPRSVLLASYVPLTLIFFALATWLMNSFSDAFKILGGMIAAALFGWILGRVLFRAFFGLVRSRASFTRLVATSLARSRFGVNLCFLSLVLVALALNLVPHLLTSVVAEIQPLRGREVPELFLFNIPESNLDAVKTFAAKREVELRYLSPMVLGRLQKVNGQTVLSDQFRRFPVRLSYREGRIPSETIASGRDFPGGYDPSRGGEPEISVEVRFAERNGFKLGDLVEFDVQGLPISARITSLRNIRWTSFNPNFFIMFQPGVLDEAPKTWISNVNFDGGDEKKVRLQYDLTREFPDLSVIDIGRTITRVLEIARSVIGPVRTVAAIAVVMSFLILIGIVWHNLRLRESEIDIQKILGADAGLIRRLITWEYAVTAAFAWLVGAGSSSAIAWVVTRLMFDIPFRIEPVAFVASAVGVIGACAVIAWLAAGRVLALRGTSVRL